MDEFRDQCDFEYPVIDKPDRDVVWRALCVTLALLALLLAFATVANAQQRDPLQGLTMDWQAFVTSQGHVATGIQDLAQAYQTAKAKADKLDALDAYLKACQDNPGCTVPAPEAK